MKRRIIVGMFDFLKPKRKPKQEPKQKPSPPPDLARQMQMIATMAFPGGQEQVQEETDKLHALLRGTLTKPETSMLLTRTKALLIIAEDKSKERIIPSILIHTGNKLTQHEGLLVYQFLTGIRGDLYTGGDGSSIQEAVIINSTSSATGIRAEYDWIESRHGVREKDWTVEARTQAESDDGKIYETFHIKQAGNVLTTVVFDISSFFGRF